MGERRMVLWANDRQLPMVNQAARAGGFDIVACGSDSADETAILAERFDASPVGDLRTALAFDDVDATWIASPSDLKREHIEIARRGGRPVLASMPWSPADRPDVAATPFHLVPLLRNGDAVRSAVDLLDRDEPWNALHVTMHAPAESLTLASLLYSAIDFIIDQGRDVEAISATLAGGGPVPETISGMTGHLSAHLRLNGGAAATVLLSDRTGRWRRHVDLLAPGTHLEITDDASRLFLQGEPVDEQRIEGDASIGAVIGREIARILDGRGPDPPPDHARLLMLCETTLLACRTGQTESPRTVERMSEHV